MPVEIDTSALERATRNLSADLSRGALEAGVDAANRTADRLRSRIPVRTGRLRNSVHVVRGMHDTAVSYGGGVPYAGYIDKRTGAVDDARAGADTDYERRCQAMAESEARKV